MTIKNLIFDLDGTLINSHEDIKDALSHAYSTIPTYHNIQINFRVGPPLYELIHTITPKISQSDYEIVSSEFRKYSDRNTFPKTTLKPDVLSTLRNLSSKCLFIATNKPSLTVNRILKQLSIHKYFIDIISIDSIPSLKLTKTDMISHIITRHHLTPSETLMIGDDQGDIIAAKNNSISSFAILDGYGDQNLLRKSNPTYLSSSFGEILYTIK